jgi:phage-related protein
MPGTNSDGSIIIDTELDQTGFEQGSDKLLGAVKDLTAAVDTLGDNMMASFQAITPLLQSIAGNTSAIYATMNTEGQQAVETNDAVTASEQNMAQAAQEAAQAAREGAGATQDMGEAANGAQTAAEGAGEAISGAMNTAGGSVTKLQSQLNTVNQQIADLEAQISSQEAAKAPLVNQAEELRAKIKEAEAEAQAFGQAWANGVAGADRDESAALDKVAALKDQYAEVVAQIDKMDRPLSRSERKLENLQQKAAELTARIQEANSAAGGGSLADGMEVADQRIVDLNNEMQQLSARKKELEAGGVGLGYTEYDQLTQRLAEVEQELKAYKQSLSEGQGQTSAFRSILSGLGGALTTVGGAVVSLAGRIASGLVGALKSAATHAANLAGKLAKMGVKAVATQIKGLVSKIKEFGSASRKAKSDANVLVKALTSVKTMLKSRIKRMFISYLMSEIKSACSALVQYSSEFNSAISGMRNGVTELGGNLAVAFSSLVNAIAPAITTIINLVSKAASYLSAFFALLGGKSTVTVAKKQTDSYADSLSDAAGAAGDLDKANKQLGIDELNVISEDDSSSGSSGSGDASDLYEDVDIDSLLPEDVSAWFDRIKAAFEAGDWYGVGYAITDGLNTALQYVKDWIDNTFRPFATTWASNIAQILNGAVAGLDWYLLGSTLASGINAVFDTLNTFLTTFDFKALGVGIGNAINGLFDNIEWDLLGETFANKWNALFDTLYGIVTTVDWANIGSSIAQFVSSWFNTIDWETIALTLSTGWNGLVTALHTFITETDWAGMATTLAHSINTLASTIDWGEMGRTLSDGIKNAFTFLTTAIQEIDWYGLGQDVKTFLVNIDWAGICSAMFEAIGAALGGLAMFICGVIEDAWNSVVEWWHDVAYEDGQFTIQGLLDGIWQAICNIGEWIKTNIFDPFINGFKSVFGINSPSTVMAEQGGYIVSGLLQGITNAWSSITGFFSSALSTIKTTLSNAWSSIKSTASSAWNGIKTTVTTAFTNAKTSLSTTAETIKTKLSTTWDNVKSTASEKWENLKSTISTTFENAKTALGTTGTNIQTNLSTTWENAKTAASTAWDTLKTSITTAFTEAQTSIGLTADTLKTALSTAWDSIKTTASTKWTDLKTTVTNTFTNLKTDLNSTADNIKTNISDAWESVKTTANTKWTDIKTTVLDLWNNLKTEVGNVEWKSIGTNLVAGVKQGILDAWDAFKSWVLGIFSSIISSVKSLFGIASPSKVFAEIGEYLDEGLVVGLKAGANDMLNTASNLAESVTDAMSGTTPELEVGGVALTGGLTAVADTLTCIAQTFTAIADTLAAMGGLQTPAIAAGSVVPYQTRVSGGGGDSDPVETLNSLLTSNNAEIVSVLYEMMERLIAAIEANGGDFYIGDEQVVRSYDRGNTARGVRVNKGAFANAY